MNQSLNRRLALVGFVLVVMAGLIVYRLLTIQFGIDTAYFAATALSEYRYKVTRIPPRGEIYDRTGVLLATNAVEYEIGISPVLIYDREAAAQQLADTIGLPYEELLADMQLDQPYVLLVRPAPATMGQAVQALDIDGVAVTPISRRYYPHGTLAAHTLGFVSFDNTGYYGVEGFYNDSLSGQVTVSDESFIPFDATGDQGFTPGSKIYLTLDSEVQFLAEQTLAESMAETGADSGSILVMDPRTGEVLAMASAPAFDPNRFYEQQANLFPNPIVSQQFEPGSTVKVMTMGIALEDGVVRPDSTYEDTGVLEVGGITVYNWDRAAHGTTSMTSLLALSLNVGASTLSIATGPTKFYDGMDAFGFGKLTGIDLQGEASGSIKRPGEANWFEADLATNAFGQGMAVTPLQVTNAMAAVANDGLLMQPHLIYRKEDPDGTITEYGPSVMGRALDTQTAQTLSLMLADALQTENSPALVPGYSIAGKTGTAEIPIPGGYDPEKTITSFIGYGPVDDPRFVVMVKLNRPTSSRWGAQTAAPVFSKLVQRLVVLLEIPPDGVRLAQDAGG
jgi:cell division protein FtsI/penicillin-binding protein 2